MSRLQQTLEHPIALDEDARASVDDLLFQAVVLDVCNDRFVLRTGLEPERGDIKSLGLLKDAQGDLPIIISVNEASMTRRAR